MGCGCIADLVNGLHRCIHRRIKTNRIVCTCNIQINGSRYTNGIDTMSRQLSCALERTVTADNNNTVYAMLPADLCALSLAFLCTKLLTSGCV